MFFRVFCNFQGKSFVAGAKIRNERKFSNSHNEIRSDGRNAAGRVKSFHAGDGGGVTAMEMDDGATLRALLIHREVQKIFFARLGTGNQVSVPIQLRETGRIEFSETRIGGS